MYTFRRIGIIKIDVEGYELRVLKGAQDTIARHRPIVIVEIWLKIPGRWEDILSFFQDAGYSRWEQIVITSTGAHEDFIFFPS